MVTDTTTNYSSPAGREFTIAAGRLAGINPASRVLDMGCGYGEAACTLAQIFRCKVTAVDISEDNIEQARQEAKKRQVSHLIEFSCTDILTADYSAEPFDLVLAEGGMFSFLSRTKGLACASAWLMPRGWLAFSDLIITSKTCPDEITTVYSFNEFNYETEETYRKLISNAGFDSQAQLITLVPQSGWDNYYAHMARRLEDEQGFFSDPKVKRAFHREIDVFYRLEAFKYIGYLFCATRKPD